MPVSVLSRSVKELVSVFSENPTSYFQSPSHEGTLRNVVKPRGPNEVHRRARSQGNGGARAPISIPGLEIDLQGVIRVLKGPYCDTHR